MSKSQASRFHVECYSQRIVRDGSRNPVTRHNYLMFVLLGLLRKNWKSTYPITRNSLIVSLMRKIPSVAFRWNPLKLLPRLSNSNTCICHQLPAAQNIHILPLELTLVLSISFDYYWAHTSFAPVGIIVIYDNVLVCVFHSKTSILKLSRIWFRPWGLRVHQDLGPFFSCWSYSTAERNHSAPFPSQRRGRGPK